MSRVPLSNQEAEVLALAAAGLTIDGTAARMGLAVDTVKTYRTRALHKLEAVSVPQAIAKAVGLGFVHVSIAAEELPRTIDIRRGGAAMRPALLEMSHAA